ncbi:trihelix transcription factor ASIL2-like [Iris pallida]|uniref:Trihelix transcription factor ASIL2-like n=1 Tax=Iris pallida TaxID=29817 RepID=A0AAX6DSH0_IRIPA|nr:trihelix transcription factor ASIL2-like [Iris pallida]
MDDVDDDDARHPPNPNRHKPPLRSYSPPQFPQAHRRSPPDSDSDDSERNNAADEEDESDEEEANNHSASSHDSRGKRRKLDRFAQGFEFAPRKPPPPLPPPSTAAGAKASAKPNSSKNSPPDWSEDSTFILLDAWGDLFVQNGRKSLRSDEWSEVAKKVNHASRIVRSDSQCRNRLDTLKKKYKKEKLQVTEYPDFKSEWIYFKKMDSLMCSTSPPPSAVAAAEAPPRRLPCGVDAGEYVFSNNRVYMNRANGMDEMRDSPGDTGSEGDEEEDDEDSDGLPPAVTPAATKRRGEDSASFRMLADSIQKFSEVYEKIEISKRQQMAELDRMRNEFQRDLEVQKRQILERLQAEIARMRQEEGEEEGEEERTDDDDGADGGAGGGNGDIDGSAENTSG